MLYVYALWKAWKSIQHLFFECFTVVRIWSWVRQIFLTPQFSNKDDLFSFIKSDGSPLIKLFKLVVITFSIWMIWRMRNYVRFQDKLMFLGLFQQLKI